MLLPAAALAWPGPGSVLRDDWQPAATGSAFVLLATFPALIVLAWRRHAGAARGWFLLLPLLLAWGPMLVQRHSWASTLGMGETFERERATFLVLCATALLVCGASLGAAGRRTLARGLAVLSIAVTLVAHLDPETRHAGALGNTGSVSQAALVGAVVSAGLLFEAFGPWTLVHAAALGLQLTFVWRVPVIAGAIAAAAGLLALAAAHRRVSVRLACLLLAVLAVLGAFAGSVGSSSREPGAGTVNALQRPSTAETGGLAVRTLVWSSSLEIVGNVPLTGVGLGQFARAFPAFRDPDEIELSSHQRRIAQETEVEHAHCDWLTLLVEGGLLWATPAFVLLALVAAAVWRALRSSVPLEVAFGAAALALLANACVHGVLFYDPVSSSLAFGLFGALLGPVRTERPRLATRLVPLFLIVVCALAAPSATSMLRHAGALAPIERGEELSTSGTRDAIEQAIEAAPDSALALSLRARFLELQRAQPEKLIDAWREVHYVRPFRVEALMQLGLACLKAGKDVEASIHWEDARALDPRHPGLAWNLATLALDEGRVESAERLLEGLEAAKRLDPTRARSLAARLELEGKEKSAAALWSRVAPDVASAGPDKSFQLSRERRTAGEERLADALELRAQRGYARQHAQQGAWTDAVRSYRQALRLAATPTPVALRIEYAAALAAAGKADEARAELAAIDGWAGELARVPDWARDELRKPDWTPR
jgi:thioredoxin-like negative regulator of GroEL